MGFLKVDFDQNRIYGLDILRALAILFVVISHGGELLPERIAYSQTYFLFDGVSIFFVLSGFLIGGILIKVLQKDSTPKALMNFWLRRWLRTLPAYFFTLFLLAVLSSWLIKGFSILNYKRYFLFLQNFSWPHPGFFSEAWSLSIEEWFYFLIPICIFFLIKVARLSVARAIATTAVLIIVLVTAFRCFRYIKDVGTVPGYEWWNSFFRIQVVTRLDSIMFGVLGAYVSYYHKLSDGQKRFFFWLGILIFLLQKLSEKLHWYQWGGFYDCVLSFTVSAVGTLFLLPFLADLKTGDGAIYKFLTRVSVISYSMYLLHYSFVQGFLLRYTHFYGLSGVSLIVVKYVSYWALTFLGATLLYKLVEKPFMDLRGKIKQASSH